MPRAKCRLNPGDDAPAWDFGSMATRTNDCRMWLLLHGFLSDAESDRVKVRMNDWIMEQRQGEAVATVGGNSRMERHQQD